MNAVMLFDGSALVTGAVVGLSISAPIGPMGAICISRTLSSGWIAGLATGAGAATILVCYGAAVLFSLSQATQFVGSHAAILPLLGGLIMVWSAARLVVSNLRRAGPNLVGRRASVSAAYFSAAAFNATNPVLIVLLVSSITSLPVLEKMQPFTILSSLTGMFAGSMVWWACICGVVIALRRALNATLLEIVNIIIAIFLLLFGVSTIARVVLQ
jgi:threonine/homoserine/homoserine lactone efflux protein